MPRSTRTSRRAAPQITTSFRNCREHAKHLLAENGVAVDEVWWVDSAGSSYSGQEEILFSSLDGVLKTAMLGGSLDSSEGKLEVIDGWS